MTNGKLHYMAAADGLLRGRHEGFTQQIGQLSVLLVDGKAWADLISDRIVYLKFYAIDSFQTEGALMLLHTYPDYEVHRKEHDSITTEMRAILAQIIDNGASMPLLTQAGSRLVQTLQSHVLHHDGKLFDYLDRSGMRRERSADNDTAAEWLPGRIQQGV
ncbi:MAG: hemerythrin family protein [Oryzomonas sp.]|uniref:hemerythrin family protein n=1 Tax=Oryzomonas sp. TaxID=2855186 RepID=UPI0028459E6A|nr:hemerythrin family protein [Oryzomonas sp.]MDR3578329.1 hemerythrin family protein [Oryzomonas sp.]